MNLIEPMCIVGASMGGTIVCMFALKYPEYVSMICLLAPIGKIEYTFQKYMSLISVICVCG
jgi:alpha-beta hydrolase superfamily lysophospholipase